VIPRREVFVATKSATLNYQSIIFIVMETLKTVSFADYKKANNIVSVSKAVRKSQNGLFVTFLTSEKDAEGKPIALNTWFSRKAVEAGLVSEGQAVADLGLGEMIVCETKNEAGEIRQKLAFAGNSDYIAI
jgi:hypothetical protein